MRHPLPTAAILVPIAVTGGPAECLALTRRGTNHYAQSYATSTYRLHYFETATGLRFILITNPNGNVTTWADIVSLSRAYGISILSFLTTAAAAAVCAFYSCCRLSRPRLRITRTLCRARTSALAMTSTFFPPHPSGRMVSGAHSSLAVPSLRECLRQVYSGIYVEYATKNPLQPLGTPVTSTYFAQVGMRGGGHARACLDTLLP